MIENIIFDIGGVIFDDKIRNVESANELGIRSYVFDNIKDIEDVL